MKQWKTIGGLSFILAVVLSIAIPATAGSEHDRSLTLSIGGFSLNDSSGTVSRWNEYRDIADDGLTTGLEAFSAGKHRNRWWASVKNPGYQDAEGSLYLQTGELLTLDLGYSKTPHYYFDGTAENQIREQSTMNLDLLPLSRYNFNADYINEEKRSTDDTEREWDSLTLSLHGGSDRFGTNVELLDSKHRRDLGQYDSDGFALQTSGSPKNRVWAASAYYIQRDFDTGVPSLNQTVKTSQSGVKTRFKLDKSFSTHISFAKSEIDNGNAGEIGIDTEKKEFGSVYKFNSGKIGLNYSKKTTSKTNADVSDTEDKTLGFFVVGTLVKKLTARVDRKDTVRSTTGVQSVDFRNANSLAKRVAQTRVKVTGAMSPSFRFATVLNVTDEDFEPFTAISLLGQHTELRNFTASYQASDNMTLFHNILYQEIMFDEMGILSPDGIVRVAQAYDSYSLGFMYRFNNKATGGLSYGQSRTQIGEFVTPNEITERNIDAWYECEFHKGYQFRVSLGHTNYTDRLNAGLSGISDLMEVKISKTINF